MEEPSFKALTFADVGPWVEETLRPAQQYVSKKPRPEDVAEVPPENRAE
jgi:hypothetical protein